MKHIKIVASFVAGLYSFLTYIAFNAGFWPIGALLSLSLILAIFFAINIFQH